MVETSRSKIGLSVEKETSSPRDFFDSKIDFPFIPENLVDKVVIHPDPSLGWFELARDWNEVGEEMRKLSSFKRRDGLPNGNGETVILNCGFFFGDWTLEGLAFWLRKKGYNPVHLPTPIGTNFEPPEYRADKLYRLVKNTESNGFKKKLIGWSKGGYENLISLMHNPDLVEEIDEVINLGSPTNFPVRLNYFVYGMYRLSQLPFGNQSLKFSKEWAVNANGVLNKVRITEILAKNDGIINGVGDWQGLTHQKYRVNTTHCALGFNPETYEIIGNVLASSQQKTKVA